jgi:hypothetical protein
VLCLFTSNYDHWSGKHDEASRIASCLASLTLAGIFYEARPQDVPFSAILLEGHPSDYCRCEMFTILMKEMDDQITNEDYSFKPFDLTIK